MVILRLFPIFGCLCLFLSLGVYGADDDGLHSCSIDKSLVVTPEGLSLEKGISAKTIKECLRESLTRNNPCSCSGKGQQVPLIEAVKKESWLPNPETKKAIINDIIETTMMREFNGNFLSFGDTTLAMDALLKNGTISGQDQMARIHSCRMGSLFDNIKELTKVKECNQQTLLRRVSKAFSLSDYDAETGNNFLHRQANSGTSRGSILGIIDTIKNDYETELKAVMNNQHSKTMNPEGDKCLPYKAYKNILYETAKNQTRMEIARWNPKKHAMPGLYDPKGAGFYPSAINQRANYRLFASNLKPLARFSRSDFRAHFRRKRMIKQGDPLVFLAMKNDKFLEKMRALREKLDLDVKNAKTEEEKILSEKNFNLQLKSLMEDQDTTALALNSLNDSCDDQFNLDSLKKVFCEEIPVPRPKVFNTLILPKIKRRFRDEGLYLGKSYMEDKYCMQMPSGEMRPLPKTLPPGHPKYRRPDTLSGLLNVETRNPSDLEEILRNGHPKDSDYEKFNKIACPAINSVCGENRERCKSIHDLKKGILDRAMDLISKGRGDQEDKEKQITFVKEILERERLLLDPADKVPPTMSHELRELLLYMAPFVRQKSEEQGQQDQGGGVRISVAGLFSTETGKAERDSSFSDYFIGGTVEDQNSLTSYNDQVLRVIDRGGKVPDTAPQFHYQRRVADTIPVSRPDRPVDPSTPPRGNAPGKTPTPIADEGDSHSKDYAGLPDQSIKKLTAFPEIEKAKQETQIPYAPLGQNSTPRKLKKIEQDIPSSKSSAGMNSRDAKMGIEEKKLAEMEKKLKDLENKARERKLESLRDQRDKLKSEIRSMDIEDAQRAFNQTKTAVNQRKKQREVEAQREFRLPTSSRIQDPPRDYNPYDQEIDHQETRTADENGKVVRSPASGSRKKRSSGARSLRGGKGGGAPISAANRVVLNRLGLNGDDFLVYEFDKLIPHHFINGQTGGSVAELVDLLGLWGMRFKTLELKNEGDRVVAYIHTYEWFPANREIASEMKDPKKRTEEIKNYWEMKKEGAADLLGIVATQTKYVPPPKRVTDSSEIQLLMEYMMNKNDVAYRLKQVASGDYDE